MITLTLMSISYRNSAAVPELPRQMSASPWAPGVAVTGAWDQTRVKPLRRVGFYMGLVFIFLRVSFLHEIITYYSHVNLYLLWLFGLPAMLAVAFTGGFGRTFSSPRSWWWLAFTVWLLLGLPFSYWRSESS